MLATNDDSINELGDTTFSKWQWFLTTAGTIMVINSVLLGVFTGLALWVFFALPVLWIVLGGVLVFGVCLTIHYRYQDNKWTVAATRMPAQFPKDSDKQKTGSDTESKEK